MVGLDPGALTLSNFLKLFGLSDSLDCAKPDDAPTFSHLEITKLAGSIEIGAPVEDPKSSEPKPKKKFTLSTAELTVQTVKGTKFLESHLVELKYFGLDIFYRTKESEDKKLPAGLVATVIGQVDIAGHSLKVFYQKNPKHGTVFVGEMEFGHENKPDFSDLTKQYLSDAKVEMPKTSRCPQRLKWAV